MKLEVSKIKLAWKWLTGGVGNVADYLLDLLNNALANLDAEKKDDIQAVVNLANKVAATLVAFGWLVPSKWQTAYTSTIAAVNEVIKAIEDLKLTADELASISTCFATCVAAWKSPDDETCKDCVEK